MNSNFENQINPLEKSKQTPQKTVVVAMSGGVDSTVCAALMKERGYNVIGVTLQLYDYGETICSTDSTAKKSKTCCASKDIFDAQKACEMLEIQHYVLNYEDIFRQEVIKDFADQYIQGYTPIPCVKCNQTVKFRDLFKIAKKLGADILVTGHYVQKKDGKMHQGVDKTKDQSYFLFQTTQEQLDFLEFPLGGLSKAETRELARKYKLEISEKPDSQNICFVPDGDYAKVVQKYHPESFKIGQIVEIESGQVLGTHNGIIHYTLGQRRGLGIAFEEPLYVVKLDVLTNTVFVGRYYNLLRDTFTISSSHFLLPQSELHNLSENGKLKVRVRSSCEEISCKINGNTVTLAEKIAFISPGQAAVFYNETQMLGGGYIEKIVG